MNRACKWFEVCPLKRFFEEGKLEKKWVDRFCKSNYESCVRYRMEEEGKPNPDNMLPNGKIDKNLK